MPEKKRVRHEKNGNAEEKIKPGAAKEAAGEEIPPEEQPAPTETESPSPEEELERELCEKSNQLLRIAAEYDNYKKRTERERIETAGHAVAGFVKDMLPAVDNMKRALESGDAESPDFCKGLLITVKQTLELLEKRGLSEINPEGESFDPNEHEAVMHIEDENYGENEVTQVLQRGYRLNGQVLRPAMVKVAN